MEAASASRLLARADRAVRRSTAALLAATSEAARARHERRLMVARNQREGALFALRQLGEA